jgi:hypothetical protein
MIEQLFVRVNPLAVACLSTARRKRRCGPSGWAVIVRRAA